MKKHDWSSFSKRVPIKASKEDLFNAWTTQENLEKWFLSRAAFSMPDGASKNSALEISKDDSYSWMWHGSENLAEGIVIENNGKDILKFTFLGCEVKVEIKVEHNENIVEVTQSKIPLDEDSTMSYYVGCSRGWTFYLTNLKSILEGGIDLRNKNGNLNDVINT